MDNIKCNVLGLNHRVLSPSIVHVHNFSCVYRTFRMLQMLIGIRFENLIDNRIKKYLVQLQMQGCVSLCREEATSVQADIEYHFDITLFSTTELLAIVLLTNAYNSLPLNLNSTRIMPLELQVKEESRLSCNKQKMSVINNPRWIISTVYVKQCALIQE
jgi:hypothetical protein